MNKGKIIAVLIFVIIVLGYIFVKTVTFLLPVILLLVGLLVSFGALVWVVKDMLTSKKG